MRKIIFLAVMLYASCSWAEIREFENFSIDVPEGWAVSESGSMVTITDIDTSASLMISTGNPNGISIGDIALSFSLELGGTVPEKIEEGSYTFEFNGGRSQATISGGDNLYMLIVGNDVDESERLGEILESLEMK